MDLTTLRELVRPYIAEAGKLSRHDDIPALCVQLALPAPPNAEEASKQNRMLASFDAVGYDVYRFGGAELANEAASGVAASFFRQLFDRYGVTPDL